MVRIEDLDKELDEGKRALLAAREAQAKLEMENARMGDELDLAKDKGTKLAKVRILRSRNPEIRAPRDAALTPPSSFRR
jgi:hypothetical protein